MLLPLLLVVLLATPAGAYGAALPEAVDYRQFQLPFPAVEFSSMGRWKGYWLFY